MGEGLFPTRSRASMSAVTSRAAMSAAAEIHDTAQPDRNADLLTAPHWPPAASRTTPELLGGRCQASVSPPSRTRLLKLVLRKRGVACGPHAPTPRPPHALSLGSAAPSLSTLCSLLLTLQGSWKIYPRQENLSHHVSAPQPRLGSKVPPLCSLNSFYQPRTPHSWSVWVSLPK